MYMIAIGKTNKRTYVQDKNPDGSKYIPENETVDILGRPIEYNDVLYLVIRYRGFNHTVKKNDIDIVELLEDD